MRDDMKPGDLVFIYHSSADPTGIAGIGEIVRGGYPDETAFDPKDSHYDPKSKRDKPSWYLVDVKAVKPFREIVTLESLRKTKDSKNDPFQKGAGSPSSSAPDGGKYPRRRYLISFASQWVSLGGVCEQ